MAPSDKQKTIILLVTGVAIGTIAFYLLAVAGHSAKQSKKRGTAKKANRVTKRSFVVPYTNSQVGLSFEYPIEWQREESAKENVRIVTCRPPSKDSDGKVSQHEVNVFVEMLEGCSTLDEYKEVSMRTLTETLSSYSKIQIQQENHVRFAGRDGWEVVYTQKFEDSSSKVFELHLWTIFTVVKDKAFCIQYISSQDHNKYDKEVKQIVQTLQIHDVDP